MSDVGMNPSGELAFTRSRRDLQFQPTVLAHTIRQGKESLARQALAGVPPLRARNLLVKPNRSCRCCHVEDSMTSLCRAIVTTAVAALLAASATAPAFAAPIVVSGSTYSFRVSGTGFGGFTLNNLVFDGLSEVRVIDGRTLTMTEDQQDLGNGQWKLSLTLSSDIDMAPDNTIAFSFGHEDALDLMQTVSLQSIRLMVGGFDLQGQPVATDNEVLQLLSPPYRSPWPGAVADPPGASIALVGIINWDVRSASYEMIVRNVPEPSLPALIGSALAALAWTRRRRSQPRRA